MLEKDFQKLKADWARNSNDRAVIIQKMRVNLKQRNNGKSEYKFEYTFKGKVSNIDTCTNVPNDLFEIDGDMCPMRK
jgi:hypothetical protein